ncbi:hypothetical protein [Candidatus Clostridium radicumherbarum]|uniref:Uncharacterized protein n=1 Tax=Candidatus Clostridium radicumherbarum TaxID=3381662 RepID=A0ABW8TVT6_9CLOT
MKGWTADIVNNPNDDYNLMIEILYNEVDVAVIYKCEDELILKYYANKDDLVIPVDYLIKLLEDAKVRLEV